MSLIAIVGCTSRSTDDAPQWPNHDDGRAVASRTVRSTAVAASKWLDPTSVGSGSGLIDSSTFEHRTITLITGDQVTLDHGAPVITPGPGRQNISFSIQRTGSQLSVIPSDAQPLLKSGKLDRRLFDVSRLLEEGYDQRGDLPLIVTYEREAPSAQEQVSRLAGVAKVTHEFWAIRASAFRAGLDGMFWRTLTATGEKIAGAQGSISALPRGHKKIWLDGLRRPVLDESVPMIGAPVEWQAGLDGSGVLVAVLDTGVDATHPDLATQVGPEMNFVSEYEPDGDWDGHGTHVASTIAGTGAASSGRYRGVAPGAHLLDGKVCAYRGCPDSAILAGMQWAVESGAKIVNMSLGSRDLPDLDPVEEAVNTLSEQHGVLFVAAAGNNGFFRYGTISSPASAEAALAVGSVDKNGVIDMLSSRGGLIRAFATDFNLKPEITAPGVNITAARATNAIYGEPGDLYLTLSGTSMATPHVSGVAAILFQKHPGLTGRQMKAILMASARPDLALDGLTQGAGLVSAVQAVSQEVTTEPVSLSFGMARYPHEDDVPVTRTVTYHNAGNVDVTLSLTFHAVGGAVPAPDGMFALSTDTLTVPAGGEASVQLTCDTRVGGTIDGYLGGGITASGGGQTVETPFAVGREAEMYNVTVHYIDRQGLATTLAGSEFLHPVGEEGLQEYSIGGSLPAARLPGGRYMILSSVQESEPAPDGHTILSELVTPYLDLRSDQTLTIDARRAQPIAIALPQAEAQLVKGQVDVYLHGSTDFSMGKQVSGHFDDLFIAQIGNPDPSVDATIGGTWAKPKGDGTFDDSPYVYHFLWHFPDGMPDGFEKHVCWRELATVTEQFAAQASGDWASFSTSGASSQAVGAGRFGWYGPSLRFSLPFERREYFAAEQGFTWSGYLYEYGQNGLFVNQLNGLNRSYHAGQTYRESWNKGVFGPAFHPQTNIGRRGDLVQIFIPLFSDNEFRLGYADATYTVSLTADGVPVARSMNDPTRPLELFLVPPEAAAYRLEVQGLRFDPAFPSSEVSWAVTFSSEHTSEDELALLPVSIITFSPNLDSQNSAPAGRRFDVPVEVVPQSGSTAAPARTLQVQVSYDDGATWQHVVVRRNHSGWTADLHHPKQPGFVSLRATATTQDGSIIEETILKAYRLQ